MAMFTIKLLMFLAAMFLGTSGENRHAPNIAIELPLWGAAVWENTPPGAYLAYVVASDPDDGPDGEVTCTLDGTDDAELVHFSGSLYKLVSGRVFDREKESSLGFSLRCEDGGTPPRHTSHSLTIIVLDENDNAPLFSSSVYHLTVASSTPPGTELLRVTATDPDVGPNADVTYYLTGGDEFARRILYLDPETGSIITEARLDEQQIQRLNVLVTAVDRGYESLHSQTEIKISVIEVDDNPPLFRQPSFNFGAVGNSEPGTQVGWVQAYDDDSPPFNQIRYRIEPDGGVEEENFTIDAEMGTIHMARVVDTEGEHHFKVTAYSPGNEAMQSTVDVNVYFIIM